MQSYPKSHWSAHAQQWCRVTSPLRPHKDDISLMKGALKNNHGTCLLFGVTPEIASSFSPLVAVDNNIGMINKLWKSGINAQAIHADWLALPISDDTYGYAIGDGSINMLNYPDQYMIWFNEIKRVLIKNGRIAIRIFARPDEGESLALVKNCALNGQIGNFHAFKWRWAMALVYLNQNPNIPVTQILSKFNEYFPDRLALSQKTKWCIEDINTIDVYNHSDAIYSFPTLAEIRTTIPNGFNEIEVLYAKYELADRCPIMIIDKL